jgi:anti-sigma-K factor RskA
LDVKNIISSGLLELYAAGLTSSGESEQVENWVNQYPEVAAELKAIQLGLEGYAQSNAIEPDKKVKEKIFATINTVKNFNGASAVTNFVAPAKIIPLKNYWKWVAAASVALLVGSAVINVQYYNKYNTANNNLKEAQQLLALEKQHANEVAGDLDVVRNPYSMPVSLKGTETLPDASAKIFWMTNTGEVMVDASNLPDAPAGKQYQFWAIVDGVPVDGGLIITTDKGKKFRMQKMKSFGKAQAFAISLEKEGGNPTPTAVVSMGKI